MDDAPATATAAAMPDFNVFGWPWTGFVTLFTLLLYLLISWNVGRVRRKTGALAPAMDGPPEFMRAMRVQMNTLEQLIIFLPLLWIAALSSRDEIAAAIGIIWPVGRIFYASGYYKDAKKRHAGFLISMIAVLGLFGLSVVQLVRSLLVWQ